jgi:hypothetical protein
VAPSRQCRSLRRGRTGAWRAVSPDGRTRPWIRYRSECEMPRRAAPSVALARPRRGRAMGPGRPDSHSRAPLDGRGRSWRFRPDSAGTPGGCDPLPPGRLRSTIARESQMGHLETVSRTKIFQGLRRRPREGIPGFFFLKFMAKLLWRGRSRPNLTAPCGRLSAYLNYTLCRVIYRIMQIRTQHSWKRFSTGLGLTGVANSTTCCRAICKATSQSCGNRSRGYGSPR